MKHTIKVYPFTYNKIQNNARKVDLRLSDKSTREMRIGDTIEYINSETNEKLIREIKGIAFFDDFESLINIIPPQMIGYDNKEEIRLRLSRLYPTNLQKAFGVCAFFISLPKQETNIHTQKFERSA